MSLQRRAVTEPIANLVDIENMAVEPVTLAGAEIVRTFGAIFSVRYKPDDAGAISLRDPVSEVDSRVEKLIRSRLAEQFPDHDIIGEEMQEQPGCDSEFIWAVDPIDGTTNFVYGFSAVFQLVRHPAPVFSCCRRGLVLH